MKNEAAFEKARLNSILIPAAGAVIAAALVLFAVFSAAYFGAFTGYDDTPDESQTVGFDAPDEPAHDYKIKTVNENPASNVGIYVYSFKPSGDGGVEYKINVELINQAYAAVTGVRCMLYKDDVCISSSTLTDRIEFTDEMRSITLTGKENTKDADAVIFYLEWEDSQGRAASRYVVKPIGK